jgi:hypothetical protein
MQVITQVVLGVDTESFYQKTESEVIVTIVVEEQQEVGQHLCTQKV